MIRIALRHSPLWLALALAGCSSRDLPPPPATLGDIKADAEIERAPALLLPPDAVAERYAALLAVTADEQLAQQARYRKADLGTLAAENELASNGVIADSRLEAQISAYQELLARYPNAKGNDEVLYQLAKIQALKGDSAAELATLERLISQYPDSPRRPEAEFRRGDHYYNLARYRDAHAAFITASDKGSGALARNSAYMAGWCQFKRSDFEGASGQFLAILSQLLGTSDQPEVTAAEDRTMVDDLLRAMALTFLLTDGADSLDQLLADQSPAWDHLLYRELAELQASKELYQAALTTIDHYRQRHPASPWSARFALQGLSWREQAGFLNQLAEAQAAFVSDWGVRSSNWQGADPALRAELLPALDHLLRLLAQDAHARAQNWAKTDPGGQQAAYLAAADRYAELLATVPDAADAPAQRFLMADTLLAGGNYPAAATTFAQVAYGDGGAQAAEAGYATVVASQQQLALVAASGDRELERGATLTLVDYSLRFATTFASDPRANEVRLLAADQQLQLSQYDAARATAQPLVASSNGDQRRRALLITAFAAEALNDYAGAEQALAAVAPLVASEKTLSGEVRDRQAAAIYRQGETALAAGDQAAAIGHFQRLHQSLPTSPFAKQAQFDAATLMLSSGRTAEAVPLLEDFRRSYPSDPLTAELPVKLAAAYGVLGQPARAADELERIALADPDPEARRQALLLAIDAVAESGDQARLRQLRQTYVERYPEPLDMAQELRFALAQDLSGSARTKALEGIIRADSASTTLVARSRALAIQSALLLARDAQQACLALRIGQPLAASVKRKRQALELARGQWQRLLDYHDKSTTAEGTFQIAELYADLAKSLLTSAPPAGLDELALEEYQLLLEEQAYPFEEKAIATHELNLARTRDGVYDPWIERSLAQLATLVPGRYARRESSLPLRTSLSVEGGQ